MPKNKARLYLKIVKKWGLIILKLKLLKLKNKVRSLSIQLNYAKNTAEL